MWFQSPVFLYEAFYECRGTDVIRVILFYYYKLVILVSVVMVAGVIRGWLRSILGDVI